RTSRRPQLFDDADLIVRYVTEDIGNAQQKQKCEYCGSPKRGMDPTSTQTIDVHLTSPMPAIDPTDGSPVTAQNCRGAACGRVVRFQQDATDEALRIIFSRSVCDERIVNTMQVIDVDDTFMTSANRSQRCCDCMAIAIGSPDQGQQHMAR